MHESVLKYRFLTIYSLVNSLGVVIIILSAVPNGFGISSTHQAHLRGFSTYAISTHIEDTLQDLIFRALLCPEIPPDLLPFYRFHLTSRKCWEVGVRGPCGPNMLFVKVPLTRAVGRCVCHTIDVTRPLIHHIDTNSCYFVYTQGYCSSDEWLVLDSTDQAQCEFNMCFELGSVSENEVNWREFVPLNGTCAELGVLSDFCDSGQIVGFINRRPGCTNFTLSNNEII